MRQRKQWKEEPLDAEKIAVVSESEPRLRTSSYLTPGRKTTFIARNSLLDSKILTEQANPARGWFSLIFLLLLGYLLVTIDRNLRETGYPLRADLAIVMSRDFFAVLLADWTMIAFTFAAPLLHKMVLAGFIPPKLAIAIKHMLQSLMIFGCIYFSIFIREFPWVQKAYFLGHTLAMYMKMHSYLTTNLECHLDYLKNDGKCSIEQYPANVTFSNYIDFLLIPTLVYELEYPRTKIRRWGYILEKSVYGLLTFFLMYITVQHYIDPVLEAIEEYSPYETIVELMIPFLVMQLLLFYFIFEVVCNIFAELTYFADRCFYSDWWNSVSYDEYARKWNKPVHEFLLRHVYNESIHTFKFSKQSAAFITFFFSSLLHEMVMAVLGQRIKLYFFLFQMSQIPLIWISQLKFFREHPALGNIFFWFGMMIGPPLIGILYCRDHFLSEELLD